MKNQNKQSEVSSLFRNVPTATQEQNTRRNSYSYPSNNTVIQQIFDFYTKQSYAIGVQIHYILFSLQMQHSIDNTKRVTNQIQLSFIIFAEILTLNSLINKNSKIYLKNVQLMDKTSIQNSLNNQLVCYNYMIVMSRYLLINLIEKHQFLIQQKIKDENIRKNTHWNVAFYRGIDLSQFYQELGFDIWIKNQKKMKLFGKPFQMKDDKQRFTKDQLHYQFKLFHPDIKSDTLIKEILRQRKLKLENNKNKDKEKKIKQKLQFELKFKRGTELFEKYPQNIQLIQHLQKRKVIEHIGYCKPLTKQAYSLNTKMKQNQPTKSSVITWETLNDIAPDNDLILSLIGSYKDDEQYYLNQHEIDNHKQNQSYTLPQNNANLSQNLKSDSNNKYHKNNNSIQTERQQQQRQKYQESSRIASTNLNYLYEQSPKSVELSSISNQIDKSPQKTKLNISIFKRANEIQQLEDLKQKY